MTPIFWTALLLSSGPTLQCPERAGPDGCKAAGCVWRFEACFLHIPIQRTVGFPKKTVRQWARRAKKASPKALKNETVLFLHPDGALLWSRVDQGSGLEKPVRYFNGDRYVQLGRPAKYNPEVGLKEPWRSYANRMERAVRAHFLAEGYRPITTKPKGLSVRSKVMNHRKLRLTFKRGSIRTDHILSAEILFNTKPEHNLCRRRTKISRGLELKDKIVVLLEVGVVADISDAQDAMAAWSGNGPCRGMTALVTLSQDLSQITVASSSAP